jgi:hypothetical protein
MIRSKPDERKLREVKAVLHRLQRISAEPTFTSPPPVAESASQPIRVPTRRTAVIVALIVAALSSLLAISYTFVALQRSTRSTSVPSPAVPATPRAERASPGPALQVARGLMTSGQVQAAREQLFRIVGEDSADAAWALARSYDPNFLNTIPTADAGPDIGEATRWYRAWYAISVRQGLVAESVPLERIINSMH